MEPRSEPGSHGQPPSVLVVGAGFSGSLTALHLLRGPLSLRVVLAERAEAFGPGLAFGRAGGDHLLNVRAGNMSAFPDAPSHFLDWLRSRGEAHGEGDAFVARSLYGTYLQDQLRAAATRADAAGRLELVGDAVIGLERTGDGRLRAVFSIGRREIFDAVVLAVGNLPWAGPSEAAPAKACGRYIADPWAHGALARVRPNDRVLLLGTGLTMIDAVQALAAAGHTAGLIALSRRGLLPHRHAATAKPSEPLDVFEGSLSARLRRFRDAAEASGDWRAAFDSLRPHVERLWKGLSEAERSRFLRLLRPYWDIHRHRQSPQVATRTEALLAAGRLTVHAGRLEAVGVERLSWPSSGLPWLSIPEDGV